MLMLFLFPVIVPNSLFIILNILIMIKGFIGILLTLACTEEIDFL